MDVEGLRYKKSALCLALLLGCALLPSPGRAENGISLNFVAAVDEMNTIDRLLHAALERVGLSMTMDAAGMSYAIQMVDSGERDGLASAALGLDAKYPSLVLIKEEVGTIGFQVFGRKGAAPRVGTWSALAGLRICTLHQKTYLFNHLPKTIAAHIKKDSYYELMMALEAGDCDVAVTTSTFNRELMLPDFAEKVGTVEVLATYPYLNIRYGALAEKVASGLRQIKADGTYDRILAEVLAKSGETQTVVHISSYHADDPWERSLREGLDSVLGGCKGINYINIPLYSNRFRSSFERAKNVYFSIRTVLLSSQPDVLVVSDNAALEFVSAYYGTFFRGVPVVSVGINGAFERSWALGEEQTGVGERASARATVEQILAMLPDTRELFIVNDYRESGVAWRKEIDSQLEPFAARLKLTHNENLPFGRLLETVRALPQGAVLLVGEYDFDGSGVFFSQADVHSALSSAAPVPIFGLVGSSFGYGHVGGKYVDPRTQGAIAGEMVVRVLGGEPASAIPFMRETEDANKWLFDAEVLERFNLDKALLPQGAKVANAKPSLYEANREVFYLVVLFLFVAFIGVVALLTFAMIVRSKNRRLVKIQKSLHTAEELLEKDMEVIRAKERLEIALEASNAGVWSISLSDKTFSFDDGVAALLEIEAPSPMTIDQIQAHLEWKMPHIPPGDFFRRYYKRKLFEQKQAGESKLVCMDGTERYVDSHTKLVTDEKGRPLEIAGLTIDITSRVEMAQELVAAKELADLASQAKTAFLSNMSHEIRTPMNAVLGLVKIARASSDVAGIHDALAKVESSSNQLMSIINDILDLSKIESGKLELVATEFELGALLSHIVDVVSVRMEEKHHEFIVRVGEGVPRALIGDAMRLSQVAINLLTNATKFTDECGQISLDIALERRVGDCALLAISVQDSGIGIAAEQQAQLFKPFQQADSSITRIYGGTGLGLVIAKKIVQMMGGEISVESALGVGSLFKFTAMLGVEVAPETAPSPYTREECARIRALVLSGSAGIREVLCDELSRLGAACEAVHSLFTAFAALRRAQERREGFTHLFVDGALFDGGEIDKARLPTAPGLTSIMLVPRSVVSDTFERARAAGISSFLRKPILTEAVVEVVGDLLGKLRPLPDEPEAAPQVFPGKRVLLVEDIEINRVILRALLEPSQLEISEACNGQQAVELFERAPEQYDLILMDVHMPVMDGYAATRAIRRSSHPRGASIPIVALTANAFREDAQRAFDAQMDGHLCKPIDDALLYRELALHLSA